MYDPTIHSRAIARHFVASDFIEDSSLLVAADKQVVIDKAVGIGSTGFTGVALISSNLRGKTVYQITDMAQKLVLRHVTKNIRRITGVKQDNRQFIIECIRGFLREGTSYRVYKFDIKGFYEAVQIESVISRLRNDEGFSGQSAVALSTFFIEMKKSGAVGLPRGLGLSATLAEYLLRPFDETLSNMNEVWFYARFVDDIFIITSGREDCLEFRKAAEGALPDGLVFNEKSGVFDFPAYQKSKQGIVHEFDFLGYRYAVSWPERRREDDIKFRYVSLDIAPSKARKIKTRVARSLVQFSKDANYSNLLSRIRLLTGNFNFVDRETGVRRVAGIYFNYPLLDASVSKSLPSLDKFLRNAIMSPHPKNKLYPTLSAAQRLQLVKLTFSDGHRRKRFYSFGPQRLVQITSCWTHA